MTNELGFNLRQERHSASHLLHLVCAESRVPFSVPHVAVSSALLRWRAKPAKVKVEEERNDPRNDIAMCRLYSKHLHNSKESKKNLLGGGGRGEEEGAGS